LRDIKAFAGQKSPFILEGKSPFRGRFSVSQRMTCRELRKDRIDSVLQASQDLDMGLDRNIETQLINHISIEKAGTNIRAG